METIEEVIETARSGRTVHWSTTSYKVRICRNGEAWIDCLNGHVAPLTNKCKPKDFFLGKDTPATHPPHIMETIEEVIETARSGRTVHWATTSYKVRICSRGEAWIDCQNGHVASLTNEYKPKDFFLAKDTPSTP